MFPNANESGILRYANTFFLSSEKPMGHNAPKLYTDFSPVLIGLQSQSRLGMVCYGRVWFIMLSFQSLICKSVWPAETCFSTTTTTWPEIIQATYVHMGLSLSMCVSVCVCVRLYVNTNDRGRLRTLKSEIFGIVSFCFLFIRSDLLLSFFFLPYYNNKKVQGVLVL